MSDNFGAEQAPETNEVPTWSFQGKDYPLFIVNGKDTAAVHIKRNKDDHEPVGIVVANFDWTATKSEPFVNRLEFDLEDKRDLKEDIIERENKNITKLNADFFDAVIADGQLIRIDDGVQLPPVHMSRDAMLRRTPELKSNLVDKWLRVGFSIERYFEKGVDELEALTAGSMDSIKFIVKIGSPKSPSNILLLDFEPPASDARRAYQDNRVKSSSKVESGIEKIYTVIDWERKIRYAKKHLRGVKGASIALFESTSDVVASVVNDGDLREFKTFFNPDWFMQLGDALQDTFNIGGK